MTRFLGIATLCLLAAACSHDSGTRTVAGGGGSSSSLSDVAAQAMKGAATASPTPTLNGGVRVGPPIGAVTIIPNDDAHPTAQEPLKAFVHSDAPVVDFQWLVNGTPVAGQINDTLPVGTFHKNDTVSVQATGVGSDGVSGQPMGAQVKVKDAPPKIVSAAAAADGNSYKVTAEDPDGDPLTYKLKEPVPGVTLAGDGTLTWDAATVKQAAASGLAVVVVITDPDGGYANASVNLSFQAPSPAATPQ